MACTSFQGQLQKILKVFTLYTWYNHYVQFVREGSNITRFSGRIAYDEDNLRFRFLEGLADDREPLFAHYFFYKRTPESPVSSYYLTSCRTSAD